MSSDCSNSFSSSVLLPLSLRSNSSRRKATSSLSIMFAVVFFFAAMCHPSNAFTTARRGMMESPVGATWHRARCGDIPSRCAYRRGDADDDGDRQRDHQDAARLIGGSGSKRISHWWTGMFRRPAPSDSRDVDAYLEFLDRRYHRLHDKPESKAIKFSAWNFLTEKSVEATEQEQQDALFVLGLAGLASERLLEKHRILLHQVAYPSVEKTKQKSGPSASVATCDAIDVELLKLNSSRASVIMSSPLMMASADVLRKLSATRQSLINLQTEKSRSAALLLVKTVLSLPTKTIQAFLKMGGGKRTLTLTCGAIVGAFWLVRPLVHAMVVKPNPLSG